LSWQRSLIVARSAATSPANAGSSRSASGGEGLKIIFIFEKIISMPGALNNTQLEILKLFQQEQSEEDLKEIKTLLITYLADKATRTADKDFDKKGYPASIFEKWKKEHFRKRA
jgi:hypothetical protein